MQPWLLPEWPHANAIALVEHNAERFQEQWHVFDQWCWLGTVKSLNAALDLARSAPRTFEADAARLAVQGCPIGRPGSWRRSNSCLTRTHWRQRFRWQLHLRIALAKAL